MGRSKKRGARFFKLFARRAARFLAFACIALSAAFQASAGEVWWWVESPIHRSLDEGDSLTIDLRGLGYGDEGSGASDYYFTVISNSSEQLAGYTGTLTPWMTNQSGNAGVLQITNAVAGTYSFTMRARHKSNPGPTLSGRVGVRIFVNGAPAAVHDAYTQTQSTTMDYDVLANDTDPNNDTLTLASENSPYASIVSNKLRFAAPAASGTYVVT